MGSFGWIHRATSIYFFSYITADPNERNNVADIYPEVLKQLKERIEYYNSTHIM